MNGALGELSVDLGEYGWFPQSLPSEEDDTSDGRLKKEEDDIQVKQEEDDVQIKEEEE